MANNTLKALNSLADQVPGLNQKALKQVQSARDISLQQQLGPQQAQQPQAPAPQQIATQRALQAGQDIVAQRQQAAASADKIRGAALQQKQAQGQMQIQQQKLAMEKRQQEQELAQYKQLKVEENESRQKILESDIAANEMAERLNMSMDLKLQLATEKQREDLSKAGIHLKKQLIDARITFEKDERGRKFSNERQLFDFNVATAKNNQEFAQKLSKVKHEHEKKMTLLEVSFDKITQALERGFLNEQDDLDFEAKKALAKLKHDMEDKIRKEKARAKNKFAMQQAAGTVIGAGVGALAVGSGAAPAVIAAGALTGGQIGGATAPTLSNKLGF